MPARKKHPSARARANKASTAATLTRAPQSEDAGAEFAAMTVVQLRAAIDELNQARPADQQLSKRGSKATLVAVLVAADSPVPPLPPHPPRWSEDGGQIPVRWHTQTEAWWNDVWTSPMAEEWDDSDVHNVMVVALLYNDIWAASDAKARKDALAEYRLQRADLGLSPYSRRRLEWTIEQTDEAKDRGNRRRSQRPGPAEPKKDARPDPRAGLHAVS